MDRTLPPITLPLETERLLLRPFEAGDLEDLSRLHGDADLVRWIPWGPRAREEVEAVLAILTLAFEGLGLHRVIGRVESRNSASCRVLERLGMRREAHFVESERIKGEWQSEYTYAMLAREWSPST